MAKFLRVLLPALLLLPVAAIAADEDGPEHHKGPERVFEMRIYTAAEGKLPDLMARFRNHTNYLFVKHGMDLIGYWTPTEGDGAGNTLVYLLAHDSREAAAASWKAFGSDPAWKAAAAESRKDGRLVAKIENQWLEATDFSPLR
ncbi:MAG: NIPSNAP family protein [Bryobacterales bacterium]|nr:NIPSNAP family protein [Bryobacterales bacterium]